MFEGKVISINIAAKAEAPMQSVTEVLAVPGKGLEGDRYFDHKGTFSKPQPDRELTLIEAEAIEAMKHELNVDYGLSDSRRNVVTRGVPLNHLVGKEFLIGDVKARGLKLCEPCSHLQKLSHEKVIPGLVHRGGLRAQILSEGMIRVGQTVRELAPSG
ncbi:MAG: MOSC domain-containing protein [Acidobacteriota bacterium]